MIQGFIDYVGEMQVNGWAWDSAEPDRHLRVEAWCDGRLLSTRVANQMRSDLAQGGIGAGDHGFGFQLQAALDDWRQSQLIVKARLGEGPEMEIPRWKAPPPETVAPPVDLSLSGGIEDVEQRPVFVLGSARSGTSAMVQALQRTTDYVGNQEGHVVQLIGYIDRVVERYYTENEVDVVDPRRDTMIKLVPKQYFTDGLAALFIEATRQTFPRGKWLDKTPGRPMISTAPRYLQMWPNARFIFMRRRGMENLASRQRKFPDRAHRLHCLAWTECMDAWAAVRPALAGHALELDHLTLARAPDVAAEQVGALLDLSPGEVEALGATFASHRPEQTSSDPAATMDADDLGWGLAKWEVFDDLCGRVMQANNYSRDRNYFASERPENWFIRV